MPTNLYGPNDNFSEKDSHVIPGLIYRMHKAKLNDQKDFNIWGSGEPLREFMHVDDLASCIEFLINKEIESDLINVGTGEEISIIDLANLIKRIIKFDGEILKDLDMPDGNPRKLLDSGLINKIGWKSKITLEDGIRSTYKWYLNTIS